MTVPHEPSSIPEASFQSASMKRAPFSSDVEQGRHGNKHVVTPSDITHSDLKRKVEWVTSEKVRELMHHVEEKRRESIREETVSRLAVLFLLLSCFIC